MKYTLSLYEKAMPDDLPLFDKLLVSRDCGFDGMELCVDLDPARIARLDWSGRERRELAGYLIDNGMRVPTLSLSALRGCPLGELDEASNVRALDMLEKAAQLCCDIGAQVMLINGYDVFSSASTPETTERFAQNIQKAVQLCASYGVILAIENAERPFINTMSKAAFWVRRVDSPYFRIYGDIGNVFNAYEGDTAQALKDIASGQGLTAAMHLKDTMPGEYRYTRYGEGHVDFTNVVPQCLKIGVRLFTAELFCRQGDWREEALRVNAFLRGYFPAY